MAAMSDYLENKVIDAIFRGQSLGIPGNTWIGLTAAPLSDSSTAPYTTEFSGNNYSRVQVVSNLSSWMGTNYNSSGTISSGSNGTVSNNTALKLLVGLVITWVIEKVDCCILNGKPWNPCSPWKP